MRQQPAGEQIGRRVGDHHRVRHLMVQIEGFAHMVQQHEQDHEAAQRINAMQAAGRGRHGRCGYPR